MRSQITIALLITAVAVSNASAGRLFGDVKDPTSEVSIAIRERGGYALMPEWETRPSNQYLPRRVTKAAGGEGRET